MFLLPVIQTFHSHQPSAPRGTRLRVWLLLGIPLHVFHPVLLFYLAEGRTGCEIYTSEEKTRAS